MMFKQHGFTSIEMVLALVIVSFFGSWIWNAIKFTSCDFESNYRCEAIHGAGVFVPPLSYITVWFGDDGA